MDGNARMSENEKGKENKDRNSGRCPETRELVKTEEKEEKEEMEEVEEVEEESVSMAQCIPSSSEVQQSDMDGQLYKKVKDTFIGSKSKNIIKIDIDPNAEKYNMHHKRRGVALIFNNMYFPKLAFRKGSEKDCKDLEKSLKNLDFEVRIYNDPTKEDITTVLEKTAAEDHTDADCLIVTVMSHGESTLLLSANSYYTADMLWTPFTADKCSTLAGKPKLFFIQACRGQQFDDGVLVCQGGDVTDSRTDFYSIPVFSDIMVAYSTQSGFYSWRNPDNGSWFIQAICEEFNIHGRTLDLLTLMTFVNRRVAINYQSYTPDQMISHQKKQIPTIVSMLTRIVHFPKKSILRSKPVIHSSTEENKTSNIKNNAYGSTPC